jgi:hypothetical protein
LTMSWPRFRTRRTEDPGQDPHWQDVQSPASWLHLRPVPNKRDPHDKSPPRTTSLRLAQQVSTSHDKYLPRTTSLRFRLYVGHDTLREHHHQCARGNDSRAMQVHQLAAMQLAGPDKSLNAGLTDRAAIPSPSSPTLPHASSARGTRAPPMTSSGLDLGSSVAG